MGLRIARCLIPPIHEDTSSIITDEFQKNLSHFKDVMDRWQDLPDDLRNIVNLYYFPGNELDYFLNVMEFANFQIWNAIDSKHQGYFDLEFPKFSFCFGGTSTFGNLTLLRLFHLLSENKLRNFLSLFLLRAVNMYNDWHPIQLQVNCQLEAGFIEEAICDVFKYFCHLDTPSSTFKWGNIAKLNTTSEGKMVFQIPF